MDDKLDAMRGEKDKKEKRRDMCNGREFVTLGEAAGMLDLTVSALSNRRKRNEDFPEPYEEMKTGPIWRREDIINYGIEEELIDTDEEQKNYKIAVVGPARSGKTQVASLFLENSLIFRKVFAKLGEVTTLCPFSININEALEYGASSITLNTNFNFIVDYKDNHKKIDQILEKNNEEDKNAINRFYEEMKMISTINTLLTEEKSLDMYFERCNEIIKELNNFLEKNNLKEEIFEKLCIEFVVNSAPSKFCRDFIKENNIKSLEIIDTPGVDETTVFSNAVKADLYLFVMKDQNKKEAEANEKIFKDIYRYTLNSHILFMYRVEEYANDSTSYEIIKKMAIKGFEGLYGKIIEKYQEHTIINTGAEILNPNENLIAIPTISSIIYNNDCELYFKNIVFLNELNRICKESILEKAEREFETEVKKCMDSKKLTQKEVLKYAQNVIEEIDKNDPERKSEDISFFRDFTQQGYSKDKVNDGYRFKLAVSESFIDQNNRIYEIFNKYTDKKEDKDKQGYKYIDEEWKKAAVKYIYLKLSQGIRKDKGIGEEVNSWGEKPPVTMLAQESLFADYIISEIGENPKSQITPIYINVMKEKGISDENWDYVRTNNFPKMKLKLELVNEIYSGVCVSNLKEAVELKYTCGLRKLAEYEIYEKIYSFKKDDKKKEDKKTIRKKILDYMVKNDY